MEITAMLLILNRLDSERFNISEYSGKWIFRAYSPSGGYYIEMDIGGFRPNQLPLDELPLE